MAFEFENAHFIYTFDFQSRCKLRDMAIREGYSLGTMPITLENINDLGVTPKPAEVRNNLNYLNTCLHGASEESIGTSAKNKCR